MWHALIRRVACKKNDRLTKDRGFLPNRAPDRNNCIGTAGDFDAAFSHIHEYDILEVNDLSIEVFRPAADAKVGLLDHQLHTGRQIARDRSDDTR